MLRVFGWFSWLNLLTASNQIKIKIHMYIHAYVRTHVHIRVDSQNKLRNSRWEFEQQNKFRRLLAVFFSRLFLCVFIPAQTVCLKSHCAILHLLCTYKKYEQYKKRFYTTFSLCAYKSIAENNSLLAFFHFIVHTCKLNYSVSQKYNDSEYKKGQCAILLCSECVRESGNKHETYKNICISTTELKYGKLTSILIKTY